MTMAQLRSAATWLKILDQAEDLRVAFEESKETKAYPFLCFHEIWNVDKIEDWSASGHGWQGEFILPMPLGVEMMKWVEQRCRDELAKLGVKK